MIGSTNYYLTPEDLALLSTRVSSTFGGQNTIEVRSLQSLVELVYVRQGNDLLGSVMAALSSALSASQGALSVLTDLQTLHNKITIPDAESFTATFPFSFTASTQTLTVNSWTITSTNADAALVTYKVFVKPDPAKLPFGTTFVEDDPPHEFHITDAGSYASVYNTLASAYYRPIDPAVLGILPSATTPEDILANTNTMVGYIQDMAEAKTNLATYMTSLQGVQGASALLKRLSAVYDALPDGTEQGFKKWLLDGNDLHGVAGVQNAGSIQTDLNVAITAAQSLNAAQNQSVRKFMFTFQQYQQSASAILSALQQLFRSISGNISRT